MTREKKIVAYEVSGPDGRSVIAFASSNRTAGNRGARQLGLKGRAAWSRCVRRPDLDHTAPVEDPKLKQGKPIPQQVADLEAGHPDKRFCYHCRTLRNRSMFHGTGGQRKSRECRLCRAERWASLDHPKRIKQMLAMARHRAKKKGIPFNLTAADIHVPEICPVLGIPLRWSDVAERHNSPSLDRLKPDQGYVPGNVIVVSWKANDIRRNFTPDDLIAVGRFYAQLDHATAA